MRGWIRYGAVAAAAVAACKFSPGALSIDSGQLIDASPAADAGLCETLGPACASEATLRTCTVVNQAPIDTPCDWGCLGSDASAHCAALVPSGGTATALDLGSNSQLGSAVLNTDGDTINSDQGTFGSLRASGDTNTKYKNGVFFEVRNNVAIFIVKSLTVSANIDVEGTHPIVIVATDSIAINGALDLTSQCAGNNHGIKGGPGGFPGGDANGTNDDALGSGAGTGGGGDKTFGGGGGGYGADGGSGGAVGAATPVAGGAAFGDAAITLLIGGGGGGGGGNGGVPDGGGGGGAIQLVTNGAIMISAAGSINAGGCGGTGGTSGDSGGGGGAGGTILLEAHDLMIAGSLAVNGGGGGPGGNSGTEDGPNAGLGRTRTLGGVGSDPNAIGGTGGAGGSYAGSAGLAGAAEAGGGGGAVGRMRFNSRNGVVSPVDNTRLSPALDDPGSTTTQGKPHVQ